MEQISRMQGNVEGFKIIRAGWINKVWVEIDRGLVCNHQK